MSDRRLPLLVVRTDADARMGIGHFTRTLALASAWNERGGKTLFITRALSPSMTAFAAARGAWRLPSSEAVQSWLDPDSTDRPLARIELPTSLEHRQATEAVSGIARQLHADAILVDGYHFSPDDLRALKVSGVPVLVIDDLGSCADPNAMVVNYQPVPNIAAYAEKHPGDLLVGTDHLIISPTIREHARQAHERTGLKKVLISFGGADAANVTERAFQAMQLLADLDLDVVAAIGPANPHRRQLENAAARSRVPLVIKVGEPTIAHWMLWADLGIIAAGTTVWEAAMMGLPCLLVVAGENQALQAGYVVDRGMARTVGDANQVTPEAFAEAVREIAAQPDVLGEMSRAALTLVDGQGPLRIVSALRRRCWRLRPLAATDLRLIWEWANEPAVRSGSFEGQPIPWDEHVPWFYERLRDPNTVYWIAETLEGEPAAQIRFAIEEGHTATISYSLDRRFRGQGLSCALLCKAVYRVAAERGITQIDAYIKPENVASQKAFARAGFDIVGPLGIRGRTALHLRWLSPVVGHVPKG